MKDDEGIKPEFQGLLHFNNRSRNRSRENYFKMSLESKRRSTCQRLMILFIIGCSIFSCIYYLSAGYENLEMRDQYYMSSYWGSHECGRSSGPCKDIPDYFKGLIYQICHES